MKSETVEYVFTVKEGRYDPFIMCEHRGGELSILGKNAFLSLRLNTEISLEGAHEIAKHLNNNIEGVSVTRTPPNWMLYGKAQLARLFPKMFTRLQQL